MKLKPNTHVGPNNVRGNPRKNLRQSTFLCVAGRDNVPGFFPTTYKKDIPGSCFG